MKAIDQINNAVEKVNSGELNPLECFCQLKKIEKTLKLSMKLIQEWAVEEATKYGEKSFEVYECEVTQKTGGGSWNYDHLSWKEEYKEKEKSAQTAYKLIEKGKTILDDDGVVVEPAKWMPNANTISVKV